MMLLIQETFQQTIQGEGRWTGLPVDFIRLWGCPVGCVWCDQGYGDFDGNGRDLPWKKRSIESLLAELKSNAVVVSGGEPYAQSRRFADLVDAIVSSGRQCHIETSGAIWQDINPHAWITLSPKTHATGRLADTRFWQVAAEVKIVVQDGTELEFYRDELKDFIGFVYLQPEHTRLEEATQIALKMLHSEAGKSLGACLSLQTHKFIGVQ